ncbi:hypothetical protein FO440_06085 [Mucilaginibacter corticis]|uniref:Uncharacterized protein n=1 Tax=Mucilaginibacter corticis TaxID=2597670 RepID=A0A556MV68_9SPHI|nr:hypothetical protein [Mucilaginibacter corticis]TSJ43755.1 hypothetical protein FO440_06085 [Mucilaginibacter corticis]
MKTLKTLILTGTMLGITLMFSQCRQQPPVDDGSQQQIPYNKEKAQVHIISIKTAAQYVSTYKVGRLGLDRQVRDTGYLTKSFNLPIAEQFNRDAIAALLNQPGAQGIRIYLGQDSKNGFVNLVLVATDEKGKDITGDDGQVMKFTKNSAPAIALEAGQRCPTLCSPN